MEHKPYLRKIKLRREDIEDFNIYPFGISGIKGLDTLQFHPDVTFFVGENGTGKSTLIEAILYEETDHYSVTREFLNNREEMLRILMEP